MAWLENEDQERRLDYEIEDIDIRPDTIGTKSRASMKSRYLSPA